MERFCSDGLAYTVYCRDPITILKEQMAKSMSSDIITKYFRSENTTRSIDFRIWKGYLFIIWDIIKVFIWAASFMER